jgi:drug/metabolite transporter (DMT)-like permease
MEPHVFLAVLAAAAAHAAWNAFLKLGLEPFSAIALIAMGSAIVALPLAPFVGLPPVEAVPWLAASVFFHFFYYVCLTEAYRTVDMGQVYPLARGGAPLLTALGTTLLVGEPPSLSGWLGIIGLTTGVVLISARGGRALATIDTRAIAFSLATALTISAYSLTDGVGARVSGNAHAYAVALFLWDGLVMTAFGFLRRRRQFATAIRLHWASGLVGGALSLFAYWVAIWAMTVAPIALVAALRETSVLFAEAIAVVVLKEPIRPMRLLAAVLIVIGLVLLRMS